MLKLHFINVGDGDSILVEDQEGERVFRLLVDAGKQDVEKAPDSKRCTVAEYLRELGVCHIDALAVTHLHLDHFAGLENLLEQVTFDRVYAGFFPKCPGARVPPETSAVKSVQGLTECLNRWAAITEALSEAGCRPVPVQESIQGLVLTPGLQADIVCPNTAACALQGQIWQAMLDGEKLPENRKYWSSKYRNRGSLRLTLTYAGRRIELPGDCYGAVWEKDARPCDLLKVPHHGDRRAVTEALIRRLRPAWAVVSCGKEYIPKKDRPSADMLTLLKAQGTSVWFTDAFPAPGQEQSDWTSVDFTIFGDGTVLTPMAAEAVGGRYCDHICTV